MAVTNKCEDYACQLLSACKTTHEVQILLQTRKRDAGKNQTFHADIDYLLILSYLKHSWYLSNKNVFIGLSNDPNFSIAVADGHRQFVAHKKFQQQLHRQWQEQRRSDQLLKKRMFQRYCK